MSVSEIFVSVVVGFIAVAFVIFGILRVMEYRKKQGQEKASDDRDSRAFDRWQAKQKKQAR